MRKCVIAQGWAAAVRCQAVGKQTSEPPVSLVFATACIGVHAVRAAGVDEEEVMVNPPSPAEPPWSASARSCRRVRRIVGCRLCCRGPRALQWPWAP